MNIRSKQWMTFCGLAIAGTLMLGGKAQADQISFDGGSLVITQTGTPNTASANVTFNFSGMTVNLPGDSINGDTVTLTPSPQFSLSGYTSGTTYGLGSQVGTLSFGNATTGEVTADVSYVDITETGTPGGFKVDIGLSDLVVTPGTSVELASSAWTNVGNGSGDLDFSFTTGGSGPQTLSDLQNLSGSITDLQLGGNISAVPEPASLALLGTGLLGLAFVFKRRLLDAAGNDMQA